MPDDRDFSSKRLTAQSFITPREAFEETCDVKQAFDVDYSRNTRIGHLRSLKVGKQALKRDLSLEARVGETEEIEEFAVGAISSVKWAGSARDPIAIIAYISPTNVHTVAALINAADDVEREMYTDAEVEFIVYAYDPMAGEGFKSFHSNDTALKAFFTIKNDIFVASNAWPDIPSPAVYELRLTVRPKSPPVQQVVVAFGTRRSIVRNWGEGEAVLSAREEDVEDTRTEDERREAKARKEEEQRKAEDAHKAEVVRLAEKADGLRKRLKTAKEAWGTAAAAFTAKEEEVATDLSRRLQAVANSRNWALEAAILAGKADAAGDAAEARAQRKLELDARIAMRAADEALVVARRREEELEAERDAVERKVQDAKQLATEAGEAENEKRLAELRGVVSRAERFAELAQQKVEGVKETVAGQTSGATRSGFGPGVVGFDEDLRVSLKLTIDGKPHEIAGGGIASFSLALETYGFEAEALFEVAEGTGHEALFAAFTSDALIEVELGLQSRFIPEQNPPDELVLKGIVRHRRLSELIADVKGTPALYRRYWIDLADPAAVLWKQHFPCDLLNDASLKQLVDAHKGRKITITYDWQRAEIRHPFIFVGLGDPQNRASFYDLLLRWVDLENGVLVYDSAKNAYKLCRAKPADGKPEKLNAEDVASVEIRYVESLRHDVRVVNGVAEGPRKTDVKLASAVAGVRRDVLLRESVAKRVDERIAREKARHVAPPPELQVSFARLPTVTFQAGTLVDFTSKTWPVGIFQKKPPGVYRVRTYRVRAKAAKELRLFGDVPYADFHVEAEATLEQKTDVRPHLPPYVEPHEPVHIEGKIVSEQGAKPEETYQIYRDKVTSIDEYKVVVPLFDTKHVFVQYNPNLFPGHFYFPAFKDAQVLLSLWLREARIKRFLDWRPQARLPMDGQGNHIVMGLTETSRTTMSHIYVDNKPVLSVKRLKDKDTQLLKLEEGIITIETKEDQGA